MHVNAAATFTTPLLGRFFSPERELLRVEPQSQSVSTNERSSKGPARIKLHEPFDGCCLSALIGRVVGSKHRLGQPITTFSGFAARIGGMSVCSARIQPTGMIGARELFTLLPHCCGVMHAKVGSFHVLSRCAPFFLRHAFFPIVALSVSTIPLRTAASRSESLDHVSGTNRVY